MDIMNRLDLKRRFLDATSSPTVHEASWKPSLPTKTTLFIYGPGFKNQNGSFDQPCLAVQTYLRLVGFEHAVEYCNEPLKSPSGELPFFVKTNGKAIPTTPGKLQEVAGNLDDALSEANKNKLQALQDSIGDRLYAALLYHFWAEPKNYSAVSKPLYCLQYPSPIDYFIGYQIRGKNLAKLHEIATGSTKEQIYSEAAVALKLLESSLSNQTFLLGERPCSLDAYVFSHLHIILSAPMPDDELRKLVQKSSKLVDYSRRIWSKFFT